MNKEITLFFPFLEHCAPFSCSLGHLWKRRLGLAKKWLLLQVFTKILRYQQSVCRLSKKENTACAAYSVFSGKTLKSVLRQIKFL